MQWLNFYQMWFIFQHSLPCGLAAHILHPSVLQHLDSSGIEALVPILEKLLNVIIGPMLLLSQVFFHSLLTFNLPFKVILRKFEDVFCLECSENAALFKRLMKIDSNPPILYYGLKLNLYQAQSARWLQTQFCPHVETPKILGYVRLVSDQKFKFVSVCQHVYCLSNSSSQYTKSRWQVPISIRGKSSQFWFFTMIILTKSQLKSANFECSAIQSSWKEWELQLWHFLQ